MLVDLGVFRVEMLVHKAEKESTRYRWYLGGLRRNWWLKVSVWRIWVRQTGIIICILVVGDFERRWFFATRWPPAFWWCFGWRCLAWFYCERVVG